jgi:collagen type III alpha
MNIITISIVISLVGILAIGGLSTNLVSAQVGSQGQFETSRGVGGGSGYGGGSSGEGSGFIGGYGGGGSNRGEPYPGNGGYGSGSGGLNDPKTDGTCGQGSGGSGQDIQPNGGGSCNSP